MIDHAFLLARLLTAAILCSLASLFPPAANAQRDKPAAGAEERGEVNIPLREANIIGVSPDGRSLAIWDARHPEGKLELWDLTTGKQTKSLPLPIGLLYARGELVFSPDGRYVTIATHHLKRGVFVVDLQTEKLIASHRLSREEDKVTQSLLSPDGKLFVTYDDHGTVAVRKTESGEMVRKLEGHRAPLWHTIFSGDSRRLLSTARNDDKTFDVRIWDISMGHKVCRATTGEVVGPPAISPDGKLWAVCDRAVDGVEVHKADETRVICRVKTDGQVNSWTKIAVFTDSLLILNTNRSIAERWQLSGEMQWRIERDGSRSALLGIASERDRFFMRVPRFGIRLYELESGRLVR